MSDTQFYGKYRGVVTDNNDPLVLGRIKARVPDVLGDLESGWALPCAPFGGDGMGFFALPKVGAGVWIEFEQGDPDYPIWSGCWWGAKSEMPDEVQQDANQKVFMKTSAGQSILLDDSPGSGGITLKTANGQTITMTTTSIKIDNGNGATIELSGPKVAVNDDALEVI